MEGILLELVLLTSSSRDRLFLLSCLVGIVKGVSSLNLLRPLLCNLSHLLLRPLLCPLLRPLLRPLWCPLLCNLSHNLSHPLSHPLSHTLFRIGL